MGNEEFYTFDETSKLLGLDEVRLKRLVSEGGLRAQRDDASPYGMKFRREQVDSLVSTSEEASQETVQDLPIYDSRETGCSKQTAVLLAAIALFLGSAAAFAFGGGS